MSAFSPLRHLLPVLLAGVLAPLHAADAQVPSSGLSRQVEAYTAQPTLGSAVSVKNWTLPVGRMTFVMASGTVAPMTAGGRTLGFFFTGKGSLSLDHFLEPG